jgi:hypothetical protein
LENRVLRKIFECKKYEVMGEWQRLHEGIHDLWLSPNIAQVDEIKEIEMGGACGTLVGKPEETVLFGSLGVDRL